MNAKSNPIPFDDSLDGIFGGPTVPRTQTAPRPAPEDFKPQTFFERCPKCRGTGQTPWGVCFKCQGKKGKTFKTSPEQRAKTRERTVAKQIEKLSEQRQWRDRHTPELDWLANAANRQEWFQTQGKKTWQLPIDLRNKLAQYGTLTEGQIELIRKCIARDAERAEARKTEQAKASTDIDVSKIEAAFIHARTEAHAAGALGVKWLQLRLDTFVFLDMPAKGEWKAAIRVTEGEAKLGRIEAGKFVRSRECNDEQLSRILAAAADPLAAAKAYGLRFSSCSCCGRELTDPVSIENGIGPICAEKWFCA